MNTKYSRYAATPAQLLARKRSSLLMRLGGIEAQLRNITAEIKQLQDPAQKSTANFEAYDSMCNIIRYTNTQLRRQWNYKTLSDYKTVLMPDEVSDENF